MVGRMNETMRTATRVNGLELTTACEAKRSDAKRCDAMRRDATWPRAELRRHFAAEAVLSEAQVGERGEVSE